MAKFLTTRGVSHHLEELISSANSSIILVSPYLQFPPTIYERLQHAIKRGVSITFIYGKASLNAKEFNLLQELNCKVCFKPNLHAKCYSNEKVAIISSLNLYAFSEVNNEEMGVLLEKEFDKQAYEDCLSTLKFFEESSELHYPGSKKRGREQVRSVHNARHQKDEGEHAKPQQQEDNSIQYELFRIQWFEWLKSSLPLVNFQESETLISAKNFLKLGWEFSTERGIFTLNLNISKEIGRQLKDTYYRSFLEDLSDYRLYWSSPFNKLSLYSEKGKQFDSIEEDVKYCAQGLKTLISCLKKAGLL